MLTPCDWTRCGTIGFGLEEIELLGMRCNRPRPTVAGTGSAAELARDGMFVTDDLIEIGFRPAALFHGMDELIEAPHAIQLVPVARLGGIQSRAQHGYRSVVRLERHWKRMAVLTAMRERETRRVRKSDRRPVDDLGNQRE